MPTGLSDIIIVTDVTLMFKINSFHASGFLQREQGGENERDRERERKGEPSGRERRIVMK